jgi:hypothetical protein
MTEPLFENSPYSESKTPEKMNEKATAETFRAPSKF